MQKTFAEAEKQAVFSMDDRLSFIRRSALQFMGKTEKRDNIAKPRQAFDRYHAHKQPKNSEQLRKNT